MDHLRNWCGKSALRCIAALIGLTVLDMPLFIALWQIYVHLFGALVPDPFKSLNVLLYMFPILITGNLIRFETVSGDSGRASSGFRAAIESAAAGVILGALTLIPLRSPSAAGIALWILSMTGAALLIFAFHEILGRVNVK